MAAHAHLKNEFTKDENGHNLMRWLIYIKNQRISGPENAHLTPGPGIYFNAFIHVYRTRAEADNPSGTNVDANRKPLSLCPSLKYDFKHILNAFISDFIHIFNDFIYVYSPWARADNPLGTNVDVQKALTTSTICCTFKEQVAQRATIAHLSPMCQHLLISNKPASKVIKNLNSFQIREQLFFSGLSSSNVSCLNVPEIKPLVVFKHVLVTKEQASMETSLSHYNSLEYFSNTQGPLIPQ